MKFKENIGKKYEDNRYDVSNKDWKEAYMM